MTLVGVGGGTTIAMSGHPLVCRGQPRPGVVPTASLGFMVRPR